jgi:hypothetical protein
MAAVDVQAGRLTGAGQLAASVVAAATLKVEEHEAVATQNPAAFAALRVKLRLAPLQEASAGRAGMEAMLLVGEHPPVTENPATQVL